MIFNRVIAGAGGSGVGFVELPIQTTIVPGFTFEQPVLTSNGTIGGNAFAVKADSIESAAREPYHVFDNNSSTFWHSSDSSFPHWIEFYNPSKIAIDSLTCVTPYNSGYFYPIKDWELRYSPDEGTTWVTVASGQTDPTITHSVPYTLDCSSSNAFSKYWRLYILSARNPYNGNFDLQSIQITVKESNTVSVLDGYLFDSLTNLKTGQTVGLKNGLYIIEDSQGDHSLKISKVDVLPAGTTKTALKSATLVYLNSSKDSIVSGKEGLEVTIDTVVEHDGVNVITVGSPTLTGSVASGFDNSNYFYFKKPFNPGSSNWEMHSKVTMPASGGGCIFGATSDGYGVRLKLDTGNDGHLLIGRESGGWITTSGISVSSLSANTTYYIKVGFNNGNYYAKSSTDDTNWTTICSYNNSSTTGTGSRYECIGFNGNNEGGNFPGSIDLSEVYVTVDGVLWDKAWATATPGTAIVSTGYTYADETVGYVTVDEDITKNASQMVVHPEDFEDYDSVTKLGYLKLIKPTASTVSMALTGLQNPTAAYAGSVCDPADLGKKILLDTTLTKIKGSEDI